MSVFEDMQGKSYWELLLLLGKQEIDVLCFLAESKFCFRNLRSQQNQEDKVFGSEKIRSTLVRLDTGPGASEDSKGPRPSCGFSVPLHRAQLAELPFNPRCGLSWTLGWAESSGPPKTALNLHTRQDPMPGTGLEDFLLIDPQTNI